MERAGLRLPSRPVRRQFIVRFLSIPRIIVRGGFYHGERDKTLEIYGGVVKLRCAFALKASAQVYLDERAEERSRYHSIGNKRVRIEIVVKVHD